MVVDNGKMTRNTRKNPSSSGCINIVPSTYKTPKKKCVEARITHFFIVEPKDGLQQFSLDNSNSKAKLGSRNNIDLPDNAITHANNQQHKERYAVSCSIEQSY